MRKCKLGKLLDVTRGVSLSGAYCVSEGERVRLTLANFDYVNNCFQEDRGKDNLFYSKEVPSKFILDAGSIITPLTEQTPGLLGCTARIPESGKYIQSQDVGLIKPFEDVLDHDFAYYLVSSKGVKDQLAARSQQTKIRHTSPDKIKDCTVFVPELADQRKIGKFLSSIDRMIELSRKRIENLEKLAKEIYDYWFVQFDFPDKNGRPYKTSGGKMVYNAELKREIPAGWEVRQLSQVADVFNGATPSTKIVDNYDGDIVWVTPKDLSDQQSKFTFVSERRITSMGYDSCSTRLLPVGTILMSSRAPIGLLSISKVELCTNQGFKSIVPKVCADLPYLYYYLKTYMKQIEMLGSGTTFKEVSRESMSSFCLAYVTDRSLYSKWAEALMPIFETQAEAQKVIDELTQLREFLLPLLMNGQAKMR